MMKFGILMLPGSDTDVLDVVTRVLREPAAIFGSGDTLIKDVRCIILPGGAYGDARQPWAKALAAPVMEALRVFAESGGLVLGIGHGFQLLLAARLLPGSYLVPEKAMMLCQDVHVRVERADTPFTCEIEPKTVLRLPIAHRLGQFTAEQSVLEKIEKEGNIIARYCNSRGEATAESNPDGSVKNIAGLINAKGNVMGMMARPERYAEAVLGNVDGLGVFSSVLSHIGRR
jgi:phosphoribosylformylglycinamidine synthase